MSEAYCVGRPPSRLLSHTARGLLQTPGGSSFSRPGTSLTVVAGDQSLRSTARGTARSSARSGSRGEPLKTSLSSWPFAGRAAATESPGSPTLRPGRKQAYGVWCRQETPAISSSCPSLQVTGVQQLPQLQPEAGSKQLQHTQPQQSDDGFLSPVYSSEQWPMFGESVEVLAEEFNRDMKALDHQIHEFSKGLHLEDPVEAAARRREELDREALEAERKRREAELRKARKKEQQARDPHTKVALKLERTRRFPSESKKGQQKGHIPLQRVDVSGNRGLDVVELVDVRVLKSRCLALYEGARYESLLEEYNSRELKARWTPSASVGALPFSKGLKKSGPEPPLSPSSHQSYEERWNRAAMQRAQQNRQKITKRLEEMRGPHTEEEVARLEAKVRANRRLASRPKVRLACQDRAKFKRLWATLRATAWWLLLMLVRRRKTEAIVVVKATLANCGEWLRIRLAMHRLSRNVVKLQQTARGFLELKHERLEAMEGHWERLEDEHLRSWYVTYGSKILDERMEQVSSQKFLLSPKQQLVRRNSRLVHAKIKEGMQHLNWKKFRIPAPLRWEVLSRYYSAALQKRIRIQGNIVATMRQVVQAQREMDWYLSQFGAERSRASLEDSERDKEAAGVVAAPAFWQLTDGAVLQLIGYCAKKLKDGKVDPFQGHPAHIEAQGNAMYCKSFSEGAKLLSSFGAGRHAVRPATRDKVRRSSQMHMALLRSQQHQDIDEIFKLFTPRLRAITEANSKGPADRAATPHTVKV